MGEKRTVKVNGEEFEVDIELNEDGTYQATVEGQSFSIEVPNAQAAPRARRGGGGKKKKSGTVSANIPGKVVTVEVKEGDVVKEGQVILILEAMKM
ncbi:MAG: biotin/lipoyl-binding protein, partial [Candidatus Thermoplasmatota archaeon]|nr:biotin/lipoyl-binding protein [Candidatus Thermoplasmatota archaeon]